MYLWGKESPANLGFYRPNQAMQRAYGSYPALSGLGAPPVISQTILQRQLAEDVAVDTNLLLPGIALLGAAMFLFGVKKGPGLRKRRTTRLRRRLARLEG